uniref:Uncharacterized protein n=1 Tax=Ditylenchus dipsaci TaxID=166011 RepID=A0A915CTK2_9BILA
MQKRNARNSNLALLCGQFGLGLMQTTFMFYYVKVFLNVFRVNEYWFNIAQLVFMVWNAINDPLFGYLQDVGGTWMKDRSKIFTYFGPLMVASFLILWFPWKQSEDAPAYVEGLHLIISLCLYDAFFSCVGVAWGALFTESTRDHRKRVKGLKYSQIATLGSVNVIVVAEKVSHSLDNYKAFQWVVVVVALLSLACFYTVGRLGKSDISAERLLLDSQSLDEPANQSWGKIFVLTKELIFAKDFLRVVLTNFVHTCRSVAHLNFASIATDLLIPQNVMAKGSWQLSAFFAFCTIVPQVLVISNEKLLVRNGAYRLMMISFGVSIFSSSLYFLSSNPYIIILFMIIDSICVHSAAPLFNLLLAEFIEDDTVRNERRSRMSSLTFSLNALIMKPAVSIAPVVIVYLLNRNGYEASRVYYKLN